MKKTKKLLLVALLMFLVAAATGGAYAYWAGSVNTPTAASDVVSVKVGEAKALATELTLNSGSVTDGKYLVPTGQLANSTLPSDAPAGAELKESIVVTYQVDWEASGTGSADGAGNSVFVAAEEEGPSVVNVILKAFGPNKIQVIKVVREITGLGLKEAKDLVDAAPKPVKEGIAPEEAEGIKAKLIEAGAEVEIIFACAGGATGTLTAEVDSSVGIKINDNATSLISVAFAYQGSSQSIVLGTTKTVTVTITMSEPANKTEYDAVINQPITIPIKFSVAPA